MNLCDHVLQRASEFLYFSSLLCGTKPARVSQSRGDMCERPQSSAPYSYSLYSALY